MLYRPHYSVDEAASFSLGSFCVGLVAEIDHLAPRNGFFSGLRQRSYPPDFERSGFGGPTMQSTHGRIQAISNSSVSFVARCGRQRFGAAAPEVEIGGANLSEIGCTGRWMSASEKIWIANAPGMPQRTSRCSTESPSICSNKKRPASWESKASASKRDGTMNTCCDYSKIKMRRP